MRFPISLSLIMAAGTIALACGSKSSPTTRADGATGTGGGAQIEMTGGTPGGAPGSGGMKGSGGAPSTGGIPSTGGSPSTGGIPSTGGRPSTGGTPGTGGTPSSDGAAGGDTSNVETGCSCSSTVLSWECYCDAYDCSAKLADYRPDGGLPTNVRAIREYADCNLVVVTYKLGFDPEVSKVFDLSTGTLVGDQKTSDVPMKCPFGDGGTVSKLSAGTFPGSGCKVTKCTVGSLGGPYCGSGGSGGNGGSGTGGNSGSGGAPDGSDGGSSTCSCNGGSMSLDCFCSAYAGSYGCVAALATFRSGSSTYSTIEEFADCNLAVVTVTSSAGKQLSVYDRTTGSLVGRRLYSDMAERCPFDGRDTGSWTISAGRFPESSCKQTSCTEGTMTILTPCPRS